MEREGGRGVEQDIKWSVREDGPRITITAERRDDKSGLYKAFLHGQGGTYPLGTMIPEGGVLKARRTVSADELRRHGAWPCSGVTARLAYSFQEERTPEGWEWAEGPGELFRDPELRRGASRLGRVLMRREGGHVTLACPYRADKEFPFTQVFCFSRLQRIGEGTFCVFSFDEQGWPTAQRM